MDEKDLIRADADGYGEKCMDCVRGKPFVQGDGGSAER